MSTVHNRLLSQIRNLAVVARTTSSAPMIPNIPAQTPVCKSAPRRIRKRPRINASEVMGPPRTDLSENNVLSL